MSGSKPSGSSGKASIIGSQYDNGNYQYGVLLLGGITLNQTGRELECMLLMMSIYLLISLIISAVMNAYNASVKLKER